jgi:hypothetical protein
LNLQRVDSVGRREARLNRGMKAEDADIAPECASRWGELAGSDGRKAISADMRS